MRRLILPLNRTAAGASRFAPVLLAITLALGACSEDVTNGGDVSKADTADTTVEDADTTTGTDVSIGLDEQTGDAGECTQPDDCTGKITLGACQVAACNAGKCEVVAGPAGTACDDGKACTADDKCDAAGTCQGTLKCDDGGDCKEAFCTVDGACDYKNVSAALQKPCDDGNACTTEDRCGAGGVCGGTPLKPDVDCDDDNPCTKDVCLPASGCAHENEDKDKPCSTGDLCFSGQVCDGEGKCGGGTPITCTPTDPCQKGTCDPAKGCEFSSKQNGVTCTTGDKCVENEQCLSGKCKGTPIAAAQPTSACEIKKCDSATGAVTTSQASNGTSCSDDDPCTQQDACDAGKCVGKPLTCNDGNPCTSDACDPATGVCKSTAIKDGETCDDNNKCTTKDACVEGKCTGEDYTVSKQCDDGNACTNDGCAPQSGCFNPPKNGGGCDDGDNCTAGDTCVSGKCVGKAKVCDDSNPCTNDACDPASGECKSTQFEGPCDDGNKCTAEDLCSAGKCEGTLTNCNDDNPCTDDACDTIIGCKNTPKFGGTPCDDGLACTTNDKCDGGQCIGKNECVACSSDIECAKYNSGNICAGTMKCIETPKGKVCDVDPKTVITCPPAADPACGAALCDGLTGKCSIKNKAEGTPCTSANKCIEQTTCGADGKCSGAPVDCDDDNPCTEDTCDPAAGCKHKALADDTACDDGSPCTPSEACKGGACVASQNVCGCKTDGECTKWDDGNLCNGLMACIAGFCNKKPNSAVTCSASDDACKDNLCDAKTGKCGLVGKKDGTSCDDGNACSIQEACKAGKCSSTAAIDCGDDNPCTFDVCDPFFGCFNAPAGENGPCDDGNNCTKNDKCTSGKCAGAALDCDDDNPCTIDVCDAKSGKCTALLDNNLKCDDGDPCTEGDKCQDGVCKAAQLKCDDGNPCTIDGCDGNGGCKNVLQPNKDCDDGDACTTIDRCDDNGKCAGKVKDCDDGNKCTSAACDKGVCVIQPLVDAPCNDGNACTEKDRCDNKGDCIADVVDCDDGNPCTKIAGPCSTVNGCTVVPNDGIACNDGSLCTIADKCGGGACKGVNLPCDDGNVCTNDSCNPAKGCVNEQDTCDDGNDCTFDKCDVAKGCISAPLDGFQPCEDGDKCTEKGVCNGAKCESKIVLCDDDNPCTIDLCDQEKGCVALPTEDTATTCTDDNVCTDDHCDKDGKCVGVEKECDDGNPCTQDSCDKLKGCVTTDLKEGTPCDDDDYCSEKTVCQGGICSGGNFDKCGACPTGLDSECAIFDDNDLCNGKFVCKKKDPKAQGGLCYPEPDKVVCDGTNDTACQKNICDPTSGSCKTTELVNGTQCEDGLPCTVGDTCQNGACKSGVTADCSSVSDACNDATCIVDPTQQAGYTCVPLPKAGTIACDADGSGCTANDTCKEGKCQAGKPVNCEAVAGECEVAACVKDGPNGFTCKISAAPDNTACEDGQLCTAEDFCKGGKCQPGLKPYECKDEVDTQCAVGVCDKAANAGLGGCTAKPQNEGQVCDADDNGCTVNDICVQGFCVPGAPVNCNQQTAACAVGACKSLGGKNYECVAAPVNESKPCEADNNGCTLDDHCEVGKCVPGKMLDCSKFDANGGCLVGTCESLSNSQGKCVAKPAQAGIPCNADDNGCTKGDACNKDGACQQGAAVNCLAQAGSCATGACQSTGKESYKCVGDPKDDGTACDADGDGCTVGDKCQSGTCVAGPAPDCSAENKSVCIVGGCTNKGSDKYVCAPYPKKDGESCDADKNGCTKDDSCQKGFCEAGTLETCKEQQGACAKAECQDKGGTDYICAVTVVESYPPLDKETTCDPKAAAGATGACPTNYQCIVGKDGDTEGTCKPKVSVSCTDGDACTVEDVCVDGKCKGGAPPDCDDDDACTLDLCDKGACKHQAIAGCGACLAETFTDVELKNWAFDYSDKSYKTSFSSTSDGNGGQDGLFTVAWDGSALTADPGETDPWSRFRMMSRTLYLEAGKSQALTFKIAAAMADGDCLEVYIDEATKVWSNCGPITPEIPKVSTLYAVDLTKYGGRAVNIEFRFEKSIKKADKGSFTIDDVRLSGFCGPACMSEGFEGPTAGLGFSEVALQMRRPQPWSMASSAAAYASWQITDKAARSGKDAMVVSYTGKPASGKAETAVLKMPGLTPVAGTKLSFGLLVPEVGEAGCSNGDKLVVAINGTEVLQRCDAIAEWKTEVIDLGEYAGKTIDVTFTVVSAATDKAKGSFVLDDIVMTGQCSWLCFTESFDASTKVNHWFKMSSFDPSQQQPSKYVVEGGQSLAVSKPYAVVFKTDTAPLQSRLVFVPSSEVMPPLRTSVAGTALTAQVNVVADPGGCPLEGADALPPLSVGLSQLSSAATLDTFQLFSPVCESTSGWKQITASVPPVKGGRWVSPSITSEKLTGTKSLTIYIDDIRAICK